MKTLRSYEGLYNTLVPELVARGLLPEFALGDESLPRPWQSPWQRLAGLRPTGVELNQPGVQFANWRLLIEFTSVGTLMREIDDLLSGADDRDPGPGVDRPVAQPALTLTLTHPDGYPVTVGLWGRVAGDGGSHMETDDMMPVNTFIGQDELVHGRKRRVTKDLVGEAGMIGDVDRGEDVAPGQAPPPTLGPPVGWLSGVGRSWRTTTRISERSSSQVMAYARSDGATDVFNQPIKLHWGVFDGSTTAPVASGAVSARLHVHQPESLVDPATPTPVPDLDFPDHLDEVDRVVSPLAGLVPRAPVSVTGLSALRRALIAQRNAHRDAQFDARS